MAYVNGFVAPVPMDQKEEYVAFATKAWELFQEYGALSVQECWEDNVSEGEEVSFTRAVKRRRGEAIVFSWMFWPDRETAETCMASFQSDERWQEVMGGPLDGQRMVFGGFETIFAASARKRVVRASQS